MDAGALLLRLAIAVLAARAAAEVAERFRQPAVLAEIAVGIVLGPSLLGTLHADEVLRALGELGAVLLLFEVGTHMAPRELRSAGAASLRVAIVGVALPLLAGFGVMRALGIGGPQAFFIGAAITATSVGITARVFADMRALTSLEARTVLGAAVADDVLGLVILAIAAPLGAGETLNGSEIARLPIVAIGFVGGAAALGTWLAPRAFARLARSARTDGTPTAAALGFALLVGAAAAGAGLAPIVGAFVAGVSLAGTPAAEEVHRRLTPIGHVLIPLFFVGIGVETDIGALADPWVLGAGAALTAVGVLGKLMSGLAAGRGNGDRMAIGIGMIPRGEVGLIFASIGLAAGVLDERTHATVILVVLATTMLAPPWLRARMRHARSRMVERASMLEPPGGWLAADGDTVELTAEPPVLSAPAIALDAALACEARRPGEHLTSWLGSLPEERVSFDAELRARFGELLRRGGARAFRFLEVTGWLARLAPEIDEAMRTRRRDPHDLDPAGGVRWDELERARALLVTTGVPGDRADAILLAALARAALGQSATETEVIRLGERVGLSTEDAALSGFLTGAADLPAATARRTDGATEQRVIELAAHLRTTERADAVFVLARAAAEPGSSEIEALTELQALVRAALEHPELTGAHAEDLAEAHREAAVRALGGDEHAVRAHLNGAPRRYLIAQPPDAIARHMRMLRTSPVTGEIRLETEPDGALDRARVHIVFADRSGGLAAITGAMAAHAVSVEDAFISTWPSGVAIDVFRVSAPHDVDWDDVRTDAEHRLTGKALNVWAPVEGSIEVDNAASPWYSLVSVRARDRSGLLARVAGAMARAGLQIHHATVATEGDVAIDTFLVTARDGNKLDARAESDLRRALAGLAVGIRLFAKRRENELVARS